MKVNAITIVKSHMVDFFISFTIFVMLYIKNCMLTHCDYKLIQLL